MKILHVIDSGGLYGAEKVLLNLVSEQLKLGLEPEIVSIGETGIEPKPIELEAQKMGLPIIIFRMRPGLNLSGAIRIRNHAIRNGFDLYHSHGYKGNILLGLMPKPLRRLPLIATLHGYTNTSGINKLWLYELLDRIILFRLDATVLVSREMRNNPKLKHLRSNKCKIIENGIPAPDSQNNTPLDIKNSRIAEFCKDGFIIGSIGRLSPEKGFQYLIEAFAMLTNKESCKLIILGEGGERKFLEKKIHSFGLGNKVLLPGYVPNAEQYMTFFNIFVLSSITEGLPIALLEAMIEGVPVVSTRAGGVVNVIRNGENGFLVDPSNPQALAGSIENFYQDIKLRKLLSQAAQQEVREKFSSQRMSLNYQELYRSILRDF